MKIFNITLAVIIACIFAGCFGDQPTPPPIVNTETKTVYIPVYCESPKINCEFTGGGTKTVGKMLKCIIVQKDALSFCSKDKMEQHIQELIENAKQQDANASK